MRNLKLIPLALSLLVGAPVFAGMNVRDLGARGDGVTDDTAAIRQAVQRASSTGGEVVFPPGVYWITGDIDLPPGVILTGSGHEHSVLTSRSEPARLLVRGSNVTLRDLGFEKMVEPVALVSRRGYDLENVRITRCRFEDIEVRDRNRGVIGLSSGNSRQRPHRIRAFTVTESIFRDIDASAINVRGNVDGALIFGNRFERLVNPRSEEEAPLGAYAIRLGESADDAGLVETFATQGRHRVEGNVIEGMKKETVRGNLIGILVYGNYNIIARNHISRVDGGEDGEDTNAIYVRGAYNLVEANTLRHIRGSDDDGALCFKGGLDLGTTGNVIRDNLIENIEGMSAIEVSTSNLIVTRNEIRHAPVRGFRHRSGDGLNLTRNLFVEADLDLRTEGGEVIVRENEFIDSRIILSQRRSHPAEREMVLVEGNRFELKEGPVVRLGNGVEEQRVIVRDNQVQTKRPAGERGWIDLSASGEVERADIRGNRVSPLRAGDEPTTGSSPRRGQ